MSSCCLISHQSQKGDPIVAVGGVFRSLTANSDAKRIKDQMIKPIRATHSRLT